ncbi:MAG: peptidyl-prolyl cis-trans isomerase [Actinobacteria bacterium]|nr:peptidyl-prolyl cis-trans isomerase [Actinomycetota bacterium]
MRRTWLLVALAAVLAAAGLAACGNGGGHDGASRSPDAVVARVDGRAVHQSAVDLARAEARFTGASDDAGKALDAAIDRELVRAEAERLGLTADEAKVDDRVAAVSSQLGGDSALESALKKAAVSASQFRESLRAGVLREAVQDARFPQVQAGPGAVRRFYERKRAELFTEPAAVKLAAIVVRNEGIAGNAIKRLRQGRSFDEVSRQFSVDPQVKEAGGMLGWLDPRSLPAALGRAVGRLPVGRISAPVVGPGGTWVFEVVARRPQRVAPFAEVRAQIEDGLTGRQRSAALDKWLAAARKDALIERP